MGRQNFDRARRALKEAQLRTRVVVQRELLRGGARFQRAMVKEHLSGPTGPSSLSRRTGSAARSVGYHIIETPKRAVGLRVFMRWKYARIHEYGGTITPKRAKSLTIPLQKTGAGVNRFPPARQMQGLFLLKSRKGNRLLALRQGKSKQILPVYLLEQTVRIPPRLSFRSTFRREAQVIRQKIVALMPKGKRGR